jgi:hypothetical protein
MSHRSAHRSRLADLPSADPAVRPAPTPKTAEGAALAPDLRSRFEARFGHDFGGVRVHHDAAAAADASARDAAAYTVGEDIHFAARRFRPGTPAGDRLLAHELAHVVQQSAAVKAGGRRAGMPAPAGASAEREAAAAAERVARGLAAGPLTPSGLALARDPARQPKGASGRLQADNDWSWIVYDAEVKLRYYRSLPADVAAERKKKNLAGAVQVGTIPWASNNPGNITQTKGAGTDTLQGYPATPEMGSLGLYGNRYAIFESEDAGVAAIGQYLRKLPSFGKNPDMTLAQAIKQYKGEEPDEKKRRIAREEENAKLAAEGKPTLPSLDVREQYLADVTTRSKDRIAANEALEGGDELDQLTPAQLRSVKQLANERVGDLMKTRAGDIGAGNETLAHVVESIHEVEGKAAAPGVRFTCGAGFIDPTGSAPYDGEQKAAIKALLGSAAALREVQGLLGCAP